MCVVVFTYASMYINTDRTQATLFDYNCLIVGIIYLNFGFFFFLKDRKQEQKKWLLRKRKYKFVYVQRFCVTRSYFFDSKARIHCGM